MVLFVAHIQRAAAQEQESVDSSELRSAAGDIEFISNTAAPPVINTRVEIENLGSGPGAIIRDGAAFAGNRSRYFVIHQLHPSEADKLDADIFGLGPGAGVDTIDNLRLIIQSYLRAAYGYSAADSVLLARYITVYNAVYRNNRDYFTRRYKTPLLADLTPGSEGLATRFDQWPGRTLMLIPLQSAAAGSLSAIDTSAISDTAVVGKLREEDDRGVEQRQAMVDLKEREADKAAADAAQQREANAAEAKGIAAEQQRIDAEKQRLAGEQAKAAAANEAAKTPEEKAAAGDKQAELSQAAEKLNEDEAKLDERKEGLEENKREAGERQAFADRKDEEARSDRESISADQREMISGARAAAPPQPAGVLAVRLSGGSSRGILVKVNPAAGDTLQTSALNEVAARSLVTVDGKLFAIAGNAPDARLIEIDTVSMQSAKQGPDTMNADTPIWNQGNNLYAIVSRNGSNYLAVFDTNLGKKAESTVAVHPWASLSFQGDKIITQNASGTVVILKISDLTE
jgi:hypothetical protein